MEGVVLRFTEIEAECLSDQLIPRRSREDHPMALAMISMEVIPVIVSYCHSRPPSSWQDRGEARRV